MRSVRRRCLVAAMAIAPLLLQNPARAQTPTYPNNAAWLADYSDITNLPNVLANMQGYDVPYLFPLASIASQSGSPTSPTVTLSNGYATQWMNAVHSYEVSSGHHFKVLAWVIGSLSSGDSDYVNISLATVQSQIAAQCEKFTSTTVSGSYVSGASRAFDGVVIDFEPGGIYGNSTNFQNLGTAIRGAIGSGKLIGFYTPQYASSTSDWYWNQTAYYYMAGYSHADFLMTATYNSGATTSAQYQSYMTTQTTKILECVSGKIYNDPTGHPVPTTGIKVFIGIPGSGSATAPAQNVEAAANGTLAGLAAADSVSRGFFQAETCFEQINGLASDGGNSMTFATDWPNFNTYWLGGLSANPVPTLLTLSPNTAVEGTDGTTIYVTGTNFVSSSVVQWNGAALATTYTDSGHLSAVVPADDLSTPGSANVTVFSPQQAGSGGGTTGALTFTVTSM